MSAVGDLIRSLHRVGARWYNTGGGCMAISVEFGRVVADGFCQYEILITDREDIFGQSDAGSDDDVSGFHALLREWDAEAHSYWPDREPVVVYRTSDDAGESASVAWPDGSAVDLASEVAACAVAVESAVEMVLRAERDGRE